MTAQMPRGGRLAPLPQRLFGKHPPPPCRNKFPHDKFPLEIIIKKNY
jgi:hypothetical protein